MEDALREHPEAIVPARLEVCAVDGGWLVRGEGLELKVDGGGLLTGSARVEPLAARARLFALNCFAIASAWYAGSLFIIGTMLIAIPLRMLGGSRLINPTIAVGLTLGFSLWLAVRFMNWVATLRPELLDEPIATVAEGVTRWPAPHGVEELLRRSALLMVPVVVSILLSAFFAQQTGATSFAVLTLLTLVPVIGIMIEARRVPTLQAGAPSQVLHAGGSWAEFVTTGLLGSRLALGVVLFGLGAKTSGLVDSLSTLTSSRVPMWSELLDTGLQLAVIIAVLVSKPSHGRKAAAIALFAGLIGERVAGQPGKLVVTAVVLFLTLRAAHRTTPREAVRLTMQFELLLALGRIGGRVLAGVFLGPLSIPLGEALGEQFTALSVSSRLEPLEVGPRSASFGLSPTMVRGGTVALVSLGALLMIGPTLRGSREAPWSWKEVSGTGWTASMPGKPVRQSAQALLPRLGAPVPVHHVTSAWKGSVFTVFEVDWPLEPGQLDPDGLLTTGQLLPFQYVQGCEGLIIGVTRENSVRCLTAPSDQRLVVGCVFSDPVGNGFVDGEVAFLANLKAGAASFEADKRGLKQPENCVLDPHVLRDLHRRLEGMH